MARGGTLEYSRPFTENFMRGINYDFMGKRRIAYAVTIVTLVISLLSIFTKGFELGVDFQGGRNYVVRFDQPVNTAQLAHDLSGTFGMHPLVRTYGGGNQVKITTAYLINEEGEVADRQVRTKMYEGLQKYLGGKTFEQFEADHIQSSQKVGPTIADDIKRGALWAAILAVLGVFVYIALRFPNWKYGLAAAIAMGHDAIIITGLFSLFSGILPFSLEIDQHFIAAILTVIGYSVTDTVVVFDRIREQLKLSPGKRIHDVINVAVSDTLSRTVNTSMTVILVVVILFLFGGDVIRGFSFALVMGVLIGTYSSIFVAAPIVADLDTQMSERAKAPTKKAKTTPRTTTTKTA